MLTVEQRLDQLRQVEGRLNQRPRKGLDFRTPQELWVVKRAMARILGTHRNRNYCLLRPKENGG